MFFYVQHYQKLFNAIEAYLDRGEDMMEDEFVKSDYEIMLETQNLDNATTQNLILDSNAEPGS